MGIGVKGGVCWRFFLYPKFIIAMCILIYKRARGKGIPKGRKHFIMEERRYEKTTCIDTQCGHVDSFPGGMWGR